MLILYHACNLVIRGAVATDVEVSLSPDGKISTPLQNHCGAKEKASIDSTPLSQIPEKSRISVNCSHYFSILMEDF